LLDQPTALQELEERPGRSQPARRLVLAAVMMAIFMAAIDLSIVATRDAGRSSPSSAGFTCSAGHLRHTCWPGVTIPIYGRLADLYGRKRVFFAGASLFLVGSALERAGWGMVPLVLFRGLQGAGAGAIQRLPPPSWRI